MTAFLQHFSIAIAVTIIIVQHFTAKPDDALFKFCTMDSYGIWVNLSNSCFKYFPVALNWNQSYKKCAKEAPQGAKGRLAVIPSEAVYRWLLKSYNWSKRHNEYWFGLRLKNKQDLPRQFKKSDWAFFEGNKLIADMNYQPDHGLIKCLSNTACSPLPLCMKVGKDSGRSHIFVSCSKKYSALCEFFKDVCKRNFCKNGGTCQMENRKPVCKCKPGFTGATCRRDINECESKPCKHSSKCENKVNGFVCHCKPGYTGITCQTNINECASNPCVHGTCKNLQNRFYCNCVAGYTGLKCQTEVNECSSNPCRNNGRCENKVNHFMCVCPFGYTGRTCETDVNECNSNPCKHGKCKDNVNGFSCVCGLGYTGKTCETNINECVSNPCKHGKCTDFVNNVLCVCHQGYTGKTCETNINECASNPCKHGTCHDKVNGFVCQCNDGYTGSKCGTEINECISSPCKYGQCQNRINSFVCKCQDGYTGLTCQTDINECRSNPCKRGNCQDKVNGFVCTCPAGYTGRVCEQNVNECTSNPCKHGTCRDRVNGFFCNCHDGYTGATCATSQFEIFCKSNNGIWHARTKQCFTQLSNESLAWKDAYCKCANSTQSEYRQRLPMLPNHQVLDSLFSNTNGTPFWVELKVTSHVHAVSASNVSAEWDWYEQNNANKNLSWLPKVFLCNESDGCSLASNGSACAGKFCHDRTEHRYICEYLESNESQAVYSSYCNRISAENTTSARATTSTKKETETVTKIIFRTSAECLTTQMITTTALTQRTTSTSLYVDTPTTPGISTTTSQTITTTPKFPMSEVQETVATVLQTLGCSFIAGSIGFTLGAFLILGDFSYERFLHMNQEIALLIANLVIMTGRDKTDTPALCKLVSIVLHLTFMAVFNFLMLEALQTYAIMTSVVIRGGYFNRRQFFVIGWGGPALIAGVSAALLHNDYMSNFSCWLNFDTRSAFASTVPVFLLFSAAFVMTEAASMGNYPKIPGYDKNQSTAAIANQKGLLILLPLNLVCWLCGAVAVHYANFAMYSLVAGLNLSLGIAIFILHSLGNPKVHKLFKQLWHKVL